MTRAAGLLCDLLVLIMVVAFTGTARADVCVTDTTAADFGTGGSCYVAQTMDGELILPPTVGAEFSGDSLPADWGSLQWTPPSGTVTVADGSVTVNAAVARTNAGYLPGSSVEFVATFTAQGFQHAGFGDASDVNLFNTFPWAIFSTKDGTQLWARTWNGGAMVDVPLGTFCSNMTCLGETHRYRIDWTAGGVEFFIDDNSVSQQTTVITTSMRPAISDFDAADPALSVDWLRMTPYGTPCVFESRTFDGGNAGADWTTFTATTSLPIGTGALIETRTGNDLPLAGQYQALSGGTVASPKGRYLQYRVTFSTTDTNQTPGLDDAQVCFTPCTPGTEVCNGLDDNCDGSIDENFPDLGSQCTVGVGQCQATGTTICSGDHASTVCSATPGTPSTEVCDGLDNDCDGAVDNGNPGGNQACNTGNPGICAAGMTQCTSGHIVCNQQKPPTAETCNGLDDNCNGQTDEGDPGSGGTCNTGLMGVCAAGTQHCQGGHLTCQQNTQSSAEICDGLDNNCNGQTDEGNPGGGGGCNTGELGVCAAGTFQCQSGSLSCVRTTGPSAEICNSGADENCDGNVDELSDCVLCPPANTVANGFQTKKTKVRLKLLPASDKVQTQGTFVFPTPNSFAPDTNAVSVGLNDGAGFYYEATIPAGSFKRSASGRQFSFTDRTGAHGGITSAKFSVKGDGVTVKYTIKAGRLDEAAFTAGSGTATIQVGTRCFSDTADTCTVSGNGTNALCK